MNPRKRMIEHPDPPGYIKKVVVIVTVFLIIFLLIETYYRIFNPFPYVNKEHVNFVDFTERTKLSQYDPILGWKGVPKGKDRLVSDNSIFDAENNSMGFRDIEHDSSSNKSAIVFLGASFTWGYEIEFNEMFTNLLRDKLKAYELFNLSHPGYGTDQEYLTFEDWKYAGKIKLVILMFTSDDVENNNNNIQFGKPKPRFEIVKDNLVLTNVPVPKSPDWDQPRKPPAPFNKWKEKAKAFFFTSQFVHDMYIRMKLLYYKLRTIYQKHIAKKHYTGSDLNLNHQKNKPEDLAVTSRILEEFKKVVEARASRLIIFFVPTKEEVENLSNSPPYQNRIKLLCENLNITCFDLAPAFKKSWRRTYHHVDEHWNSNGHRLAAETIYNFLINDATLNLQSEK